MKKITYTLLLFLSIINAFAQDTPPSGATVVSPNLTWYKKITPSDTLIYGYSNNNWINLARRSWVKRFVDSITAINAITVSNGLTRVGNEIKLGGTLIDYTQIFLDGNNFEIFDNERNIGLSIQNFQTVLRGGHDKISDLILGNDYTRINAFGSILKLQGGDLNPEFTLGAETGNFIAHYDKNYRGSFTQYSLIDKGYVDSITTMQASLVGDNFFAGTQQIDGNLYVTGQTGSYNFRSSTYAGLLLAGDVDFGQVKTSASNTGPFVGWWGYRNSIPDFRAGSAAGGTSYNIERWDGISEWLHSIVINKTDGQVSIMGSSSGVALDVYAGDIRLNNHDFISVNGPNTTRQQYNQFYVANTNTANATAYRNGSIIDQVGYGINTTTLQFPTAVTGSIIKTLQPKTGIIADLDDITTTGDGRYLKLTGGNYFTGAQNIGTSIQKTIINDNVIDVNGISGHIGVNDGTNAAALLPGAVYTSGSDGNSSTLGRINLRFNNGTFETYLSAPSLPTANTNYVFPTKTAGLYTLATTADVISYTNGLGLSLTGNTFGINQAFSPIWTSLHTHSLPNIGTITTPIVVLTNPTLATSGALVQQSPSIEFDANVWNTTTSANNTFSSRIDLQPVAGTSPQANLLIRFNNNGAGYTSPFKLTNFGDLSINSIVNVNNPLNGQLSLINNGMLFTRNIADANPAFIVNNVNLGTTGNIQTWQWNNADRVGINRLGTVYTTNYNLATTYVPAFLATNPTAATVGTPVQYSPTIDLKGNAWNTTSATSNTTLWQIVNQPGTGSSVSSVLNFISTLNAGSANTIFQLTSAGNINATNQIGVSRNALTTTPSIAFNAFNNTASTSAIPVQMSPNYTFLGTGWQTGGTPQSVLQFATMDLLPVSGTTVTSNWRLGFASGGAFNYPFTISNTGDITTTAVSTYSTGGNALIARNSTSGKFETLSGTSNQLLGLNLAGTAAEYKTLAGGNNASVSTSPGLIVISNSIRTFRATSSGTGSATTITIPHGQAAITSTSICSVTSLNAASTGNFYVTKDATNIYINYTMAPASGTNNLSYDVYINP